MRFRAAVIGLTILLALAASADAKQKKSGGGDSETACINWCFDHNSTTSSRDKCLNQCECYYHGDLCLGGAAGSSNLNATPLPNGRAP